MDEKRKMLHEEYELRMFWTDTVILLSLDLAPYFVQELRMELFYSKELQKEARNLLVKPQRDVRYEVWLAVIYDAVPEGFLASVSRTCGPNAVGLLKGWVDAAFLNEHQEMVLWKWNDCFCDVVQKWENAGPEENIPLCKPEDAFLRVMVRDHLSHKQHVRSEIGAISGTIDSTWDAFMDQKNDHLPEYSYMHLNTMCGNYISKLFWLEFTRHLNESQIEALQRYTGIAIPAI
ncbi:MAG: hypothetical protein ABFD64_13195 [Armatimonadota bacterium]